MNKILVILGPTATGKTDLALSLAQKYNGELVACDSRQVYFGLDIGTGKEPGKKEGLKINKQKGFWEINGIKIWMYDVASPNEQYTVKDYVEQVSQVIDDIVNRGKLPIIVGGTGLYLKALLQGFSNLNIPVDLELRRELEKLSLEELQKKLIHLSPIAWKNLNESDQKNTRRLLRAIELISMNPYTKTNKQKGLEKNYQVLKIGLTAPRSILNKRIDLRILSWIHQGLIEEGERLLKEGISPKRMRDLGLEYKVLADFLERKINQEEFINQLKSKNHQYAKRQVTWFKKEKNVLWFDIEDKNLLDEVEKAVSLWYDSTDDKKD